MAVRASRILCVDDDPQILTVVTTTLRRSGHDPVGAANAGEALRVVESGTIDLVISDYQMPGITGLELLEMLRSDGHDVPLIMLTGHASIEHAVLAMRAGATDYLAKPFERPQLEMAVGKALEVGRLRRENQALRNEVSAQRGARRLLGASQPMRQVMQLIDSAATTRATVLLSGESGTGKELVARAIHESSDRRNEAFITLNCAALPPGLIESALLGHERGAFTGAFKRVIGAFERAHGGTILLDEITEMRLDLQAKLLRVLQEQEFERVGGTTPIKVDARVIATTNRGIEEEVGAGRFRQDLYYRIKVLSIALPALRDRREDIPLLAAQFAARAAADLGKRIDGFSPAATALLEGNDWPGNVRELQHAVERAVILSAEPILQPYLFEAQRKSAAATATDPAVSPEQRTGHRDAGSEPSIRIELDSYNLTAAEDLLIQRALAASDNNRRKAAELLGISDRTLRKRLNAPV